MDRYLVQILRLKDPLLPKSKHNRQVWMLEKSTDGYDEAMGVAVNLAHEFSNTPVRVIERRLLMQWN